MKSVSEFFPDALGYPVQDVYRQQIGVGIPSSVPHEPGDGLWQTLKGPDGKSVRVQIEVPRDEKAEYIRKAKEANPHLRLLRDLVPIAQQMADNDRSVLNPPPEPDLTFEVWYAELHRLEIASSHAAIACGRDDTAQTRHDCNVARDALLAHARKRIRP